MKKYYFTNLQEIISEIKNNNFDRNFTSVLGEAYFSEENICFSFKYDVFTSLGFLFHFFNTEQYDVTDEEFKDIILKLIALNDKENNIQIKKIVYKKQIDEIENKFLNKQITEEVYTVLKHKFLN